MEPLDRIFEVIPLDESHRVKGPAVWQVTKPVHRHNPRMLQSPGHLCLELESGTETRLEGKLSLDFLKGNITVQLGVAGNEDLAQSPRGMRSKNDEAGSGRRRAADDRRSDTSRRVVLLALPRGRNMPQAGSDLRIGDARKVLANRADRGEGCQALLGIIVEFLEVLGDESIQKPEFIRRECAALHEDFAQWAHFVVNPAIEGVEQGIAIDEVVLQRE